MTLGRFVSALWWQCSLRMSSHLGCNALCTWHNWVCPHGTGKLTCAQSEHITARIVQQFPLPPRETGHAQDVHRIASHPPLLCVALFFVIAKESKKYVNDRCRCTQNELTRRLAMSAPPGEERAYVATLRRLWGAIECSVVFLWLLLPDGSKGDMVLRAPPHAYANFVVLAWRRRLQPRPEPSLEAW